MLHKKKVFFFSITAPNVCNSLYLLFSAFGWTNHLREALLHNVNKKYKHSDKNSKMHFNNYYYYMYSKPWKNKCCKVDIVKTLFQKCSRFYDYSCIIVKNK